MSIKVEDVIQFIQERRAHMDNLSMAIAKEMDENDNNETIVSTTLMDQWNVFNNELISIQEELEKGIV